MLNFGVTISIKTIKPSRINIDAIRLELLGALRKEGTMHRRILARTVTTWRKKPKFESLIGLDRKGNATVLTGPSGNKKAAQRWVWADEGTPPHIIRARRAPYLRFRYPYTAKTRPGKFTSRASKHGRNWARRLWVRHPGIEKRGWSEKLTKRRTPKFTQSMIGAIQRGAKKAYKN